MKMDLLLFQLILYLQIFTALTQTFKTPDFTSEWLPLQAQTYSDSRLSVFHGLGVVPNLVEVLVKAVDGANENFTFKAMGNGERDDDGADSYGGVVYIYNHLKVWVIAPNGVTGAVYFASGGVIYTGEPPYWTGINSQWSDRAYIQVRCWLPASLPSPCFQSFGSSIMTGLRRSINTTYFEIPHGLGRYPDLVKVRARLNGSYVSGYYSDAQGSVTGQFTSLSRKAGGLKFAYSDTAIRVWATSLDNEVLYSTHDGWGKTGVSSSGELEVYAWCDLDVPIIYTSTITVGPSMADEEHELLLPTALTLDENIMLTLMAKVETGPNAGFWFEGVGSAKGNNYDIDLEANPCAYGGIIYAYSGSAIRLWRPMAASGSPVCINEDYGFGMNAQAVENVIVIVNVIRLTQPIPLPEYNEPVFSCHHFRRVGENVSYNGQSFMKSVDVMSLVTCYNICLGYEYCTTFTYKQNICFLFERLNETLLYSEPGSEVWTVDG